MTLSGKWMAGVAGLCAAAIGVAFACASLGTAAVAAQQAPLAIAEMGTFYAGGHYDTDHPDRHIVGQIYVEYQIPAQRRHAFPIVMVHGGGQTGAGWWSTPDGRPGWAQFFLRHGYAVYVVDQIGRGRSPFTPEVYGETSSQSLDYVQQKFTTQQKFRLWPQAALHTQLPGAANPATRLSINISLPKCPAWKTASCRRNGR